MLFGTTDTHFVVQAAVAFEKRCLKIKTTRQDLKAKSTKLRKIEIH